MGLSIGDIQKVSNPDGTPIGSIPNGSNVVEGSTTDAAAKSAAATGTLSAKLRGLVEMVFDVWDSTSHRLKISLYGKNATDGDTPIDVSTEGADAVSNTTNRLRTAARPSLFNGATWDRWYSEAAAGYGLGAALAAIRRSQKAATNVTITIGTSTTISDAFDARGYAILGLVVPATFDGTTITFQVSADNATFQALYDSSNNQVSMTVAAGRSYDLPSELASWPYWKIVCGTAQTTTDTVFVVVAKG